MGACQSHKVKTLFRGGNYHRFVPVGKRRIKVSKGAEAHDAALAKQAPAPHGARPLHRRARPIQPSPTTPPIHAILTTMPSPSPTHPPLSTTQDGECCMVWSRDGSVKKHVGPKLKRMFFSNIRFCQRHVADQDSYLVVKFRDGRKEHIRGPCFCFEDPVIHQSITLHAAVSLNASEAIVVYRENHQGFDDNGDNGGECKLQEQGQGQGQRQQKQPGSSSSSKETVVVVGEQVPSDDDAMFNDLDDESKQNGT